MDQDSKDFMKWIDAIAKGIIAGAAIGYLFSFTDMMPSGKAVVLAGCLASITFKNRQDDRKDAEK